MNDHPHRIIADGIPIGHFQNKEDAMAAMRFCDKGMVIPWENYSE